MNKQCKENHNMFPYTRIQENRDAHDFREFKKEYFSKSNKFFLQFFENLKTEVELHSENNLNFDLRKKSN